MGNDVFLCKYIIKENMCNSLDLSSEVARKKNYNSIDLAKFIFAIFIVMIHVSPFETDTSLMNCIVREYIAKMAVPFYFVASGYFLFRKIKYENFDKTVTLKYAWRILGLYLIWEAIYLIPIVYFDIIKCENGYLYGILESICNFFFGGYYHLWYMNATVVAVLMLTFFAVKKISVKKVIMIGMLLYIVGLLGGTYFGLIEGLEKYSIIWNVLKLIGKVIGTTRNGIFMGFFFMVIGMLFAYKPIKLNMRSAILCFLISMGLFFLEVCNVMNFGYSRDKDLYIFLVPAVFFLFYIISHIDLKDHPVYKELRIIGILVYFVHIWVHIIVGKALEILYSQYSGLKYMGVLGFSLTLCVSMIVAMAIRKVSKIHKFSWLRKLY